jgi:hypothetical protein
VGFLCDKLTLMKDATIAYVVLSALLAVCAIAFAQLDATQGELNSSSQFSGLRFNSK